MKEPIVYVFSVPSGYFKIGVSKNYKRRIKELQPGNPEPITLFATCGTEGVDPFVWESTMHRFLSEIRQCGEWFKGDRSDLDRAWKRTWVELVRPDIKERWRRIYKIPPEPGEVCFNCGYRRSMPAAERQRRYRERKNA